MAEYVNDPTMIESNNPIVGKLNRNYQMCKNAGNGSTVYSNTAGIKVMTLDLSGTFGGASVQVVGSNDPDANGNSAPGHNIGAAITQAGFTTITGPYKWLKLVITGGTGTSITALLHGAA